MSSNYTTEVQGDFLVIKVDLTKDSGKSKTGKSTIISSTHGAQPIPGLDQKVRLNLNLYKY